MPEFVRIGRASEPFMTDGLLQSGVRRQIRWDDASVASMSPRTYVLATGAGLIALGLVPLPFVHASLDSLVLLGVALVVCWAAVFASNGRSEGIRGARKATTVAVLVLSTLILAPFGVVGVLLVMHADPLAIYLSGLILFGLAGTLVVLFLVVFFAARWIHRRADDEQRRRAQTSPG
jgi:hypothetical protein